MAGDILDKFLVSSQEENLSLAYNNLYQFLSNLPEPRSEKQNARWQRYRSLSIQMQGDDSLCTLFPEDINKDSYIIKSTLNILGRSGIKTKKNLSETEVTLGDSEVGEKVLNLVNILKNIIKAEDVSNK